jgi:hypothetical protein
MTDYLIAIVLFPLIVIGWVIVQQISRNYARAHPEFGPPREEGTGCGSSCLCSAGGHCRNRNQAE